MTTLLALMRKYIASHPAPKLGPDGGIFADEMLALGHTPRATFPMIVDADVKKAERRLGFQIPPLLTAIYLEITNGISGFAYEIMGLEKGCTCHFGELVETYKVFEEDAKPDGKPWRKGLLPFCSWGCNIFSCVDCNDSRYLVSTCREFDELSQNNYTIDGFFEMWVKDLDILAQEPVEIEEVEILNPFTGKKAKLKRRKEKGK